MSLTITSRIKTIEGLTVEDAYGRVAVADQIDGTYLQAQLTIFASETDYLNQNSPINAAIETALKVPYDRTTDGTDILDLAHDQLIALLASQNIDAVKNL